MRARTKSSLAAPEACSPVLHPALNPALNPARARELAAVFKSLADPTRVRMVSLLLGAGERGLCVCVIGASFPLRQPTISHHLRVLRDAGLLRARKEGLWVYYSLNRERLDRLGVTLPAPDST